MVFYTLSCALLPCPFPFSVTLARGGAKRRLPPLLSRDFTLTLLPTQPVLLPGSYGSSLASNKGSDETQALCVNRGK